MKVQSIMVAVVILNYQIANQITSHTLNAWLKTQIYQSSPMTTNNASSKNESILTHGLVFVDHLRILAHGAGMMDR